MPKTSLTTDVMDLEQSATTVQVHGLSGLLLPG